jgi:uncharacterized SAM-binding protein YcdF (DUF218 family)
VAPSPGPGSRTKVKVVLRRGLMGIGAGTTLLSAWLASPVPLGFDRPLFVNEAPVRARAIVCLGAGVDDGLPSSAGWHRIRTSVRLHREGYAPVVIFAGGPVYGSEGRPVAEVYAEAARLAGLPAEAVVLESGSTNTADHPQKLGALALFQGAGSRAEPLIVVTTPFHGLRAALVFRHAGYTGVRVVTRHPAPHDGPDEANGRFTRRTAAKLYAFLASLEEWAAIASYKANGWI